MSGDMFKRIYGVARRECGIMRKNLMYLFCMVVFPVIVTVFFTSLMADGQPTDMPVGVVDHDNTATTRTLVRKLDAFQATKVTARYASVAEARRAIQRNEIYAERNKILDGKDLAGHISEVIEDTVARCVAGFCPVDSHEGERDLEGLYKWVVELTGRPDAPRFADASYEELKSKTLAFVEECYDAKAERLGPDIVQDLNRQVMLRVIDTRWMSYLQEMDYLKTGIGLRGFGQRDPLVEYKSEAYAAFSELVNTMYEDFLRTILRIEVAVRPPAAAREEEPSELRGARYSGPAEVDGDQGPRRAAAAQGGAGRPAPAPVAKPTTYRKEDDPDIFVGVGRNDPCPCGSGLKFKKCHGKNR